MTPRLQLEHVVRRYRTGRSGQVLEALRVPSLRVDAGEALGVVGPNGSGKSTLLETLAFLDRPEEGKAHLDGRDIWSTGGAFAARRRCGMLLQRAILFKTSVLQNVMYPLRIRGLSRAASMRRAQCVLRQTKLEGLARRGHRQLSGGQRQRVALARVLALEPDILLLDEPTAHVDYFNTHWIEDCIRELRAGSDMTVILATHDLGQARSLTDRVVTLLDGQLHEGAIENLWIGRIDSNQDGLVFAGQTGPTFGFGSLQLADASSQTLTSSEHPRVWASLDPTRLELIPAESLAEGAPGGHIEAIRQEAERWWVTVRDADTSCVQVSVPRADRAGPEVAVGNHVRIRIGAQALRVYPIRSSD